MKILFYIGVVGMILFEIANVYFIMPMPGSQRMISIDLAYFLYSSRWIYRMLFAVLIMLGIANAFKQTRWLALLALVLVAGVGYAFNFRMAADHMFYQPGRLVFSTARDNKVVKLDREIVGVSLNGQAKAYPIQYVGYHHQIRDTVGGQVVIVTYCTVCRTARVFRPVVNNQPELFRLVGMDHFNAMFEDATTGSWWRQANGEAVAGPLRGDTLPEVFSQQMTMKQWLALHPNSLIMQPDTAYNASYAKLDKYERGKGGSDLTKTDSLSWREKSWVIGLELNKQTKAYDWNRLKRERVISDTLGGKPVMLVLASDDRSFFAYERPLVSDRFILRHDTLTAGKQLFSLSGHPISNSAMATLTRIPAYQEFWHSWQTFHPKTARY
ncbi:hypothetical protein GCM10028806_03770 [Spirosoma terrae]|uniref:DUF3179 domain-containing protein n=1 Tax=Spirosoma terrae TaxID=1968276 RepID=A0A6L9LEL3_9BACT|nr:DUF3179 domain-containing (seleno)protein [Spirosoma terrae]NDU98067.1 DUF3179 domain-containing protein [Spirosoma terrae]